MYTAIIVVMTFGGSFVGVDESQYFTKAQCSERAEEMKREVHAINVHYSFGEIIEVVTDCKRDDSQAI